MWLYAVYCLGAFNACQGIFYTESNPDLSYSIQSGEDCRTKAIERAKQTKAKNPDKNIVWKCIDYSDVVVKEAK